MQNYEARLTIQEYNTDTNSWGEQQVYCRETIDDGEERVLAECNCWESILIND